MVERWSGAIEAQVEPGDRVVLATPNGYRQLLATLAVARAGGVAVPVNAQMRPSEIDHVVDDAGATLVVRDTAELDRRRAAAHTRRPRPPSPARTTWPRSSTRRGRPASRRVCSSATGH